MAVIPIEDFEKVELRVGTIVEVRANKKSRNPAWVLKIDFGPEIGIMNSSAQITDLYSPELLMGTQVICCTNLPPLRIGSVKSEVRVLGTASGQGVVLLRPDRAVRNGDRVF